MGGSTDPYALYSTRSTLDFKEGLMGHMLELFPFLDNVTLLRQWAGMADMTPDFSPIMGLTPVENYYIDSGWGTWGFKATPVCGKRMAETVATGKVPDMIAAVPPRPLRRFRPGRRKRRGLGRALRRRAMKILNCPLNGPRNISEFVWGGEVQDDAGPAPIWRSRLGRLRVPGEQQRRRGPRVVVPCADLVLVHRRAQHGDRRDHHAPIRPASCSSSAVEFAAKAKPGEG